MSQRRTLILVAAIVIGALSSFLVWNYVNGVRDDAFESAEQVPVWMVKEAMPQGTSGMEAAPVIVQENIPRKFKPANAIADIADISGKVAVSDLVPNQIVVSSMFVDPSDPTARISFADRLTRIRDEDQTAITIRVDQVRGVAGLVKPGDYVNIMVVGSGAENDGAEGGEGGPAPTGSGLMFDQEARYLYQKAEVLAVDQNALPEAGRAVGEADDNVNAAVRDEGIITLIVPTRAAQYIASVLPEKLYLALVAPDYEPVPQSPLDFSEAVPAEDPARQTPYGPSGPDSAE